MWGAFSSVQYVLGFCPRLKTIFCNVCLIVLVYFFAVAAN